MTTQHDQLIGGLNEKELMNADYIELPESGIPGYRRVFDSSLLGWTHDRTLSIVIACYKRHVDEVIALLPVEPTDLTSTGGKNNNGTAADRIHWGADYKLDAVTGQQLAGAAYAKLTAVYKKRISEAEDTYPAGLTIIGVAGVYTVTWNGNFFRSYDTGQGSNGTLGVQFVKMPRKINRVRYIYSSNGILYQRDDDLHYNYLSIQFDGYELEQCLYLAKTETAVAAFEIASGTEGSEVISSSVGDTSYAASLAWEFDASECRLVFSTQSFWVMRPA